LLLVEELAGLLNASVKQRPVLHNELDVLDGQVNEHTSDLGGFGADDLLDVLVEDRANLVLVVGVLGHDGVDDGVACHQVALVDVHLLHLLLLLLLLLLHHHLLLLLRLGHMLLGSWVRTACSHLHLSLSATRHLTGMHAVASHLATLVVAAVVGTHLALGVTTLRVATLATGTSHSHWALLLLHKVWHRLKEHLEIELELFLVGEVGPFGTLGVLLTEELEIVLVLGGFVIQITNLFNLVMIDGHGLVIDGSDVFFGGGGLIGLLEADKGIKLLNVVTGRVHSEALDLTEGREVLAELVLRHIVRETFHVKVASLLGALVLDGLTEAFGFTVSLLESLLNVELLVVGELLAVDH